MCVFQAVLSVGRGDYPTICFFSGAVTPYNLEALYRYVLERVTDQEVASHPGEVKVTVTGAHKESLLPEISRRLQRLEAQGVKIVIA